VKYHGAVFPPSGEFYIVIELMEKFKTFLSAVV